MGETPRVYSEKIERNTERNSSSGFLASLRQRFRLAAVLAVLSTVGCATVKETKKYTTWEEIDEGKVVKIKTKPKFSLELKTNGSVLSVVVSQHGEFQTVQRFMEEEVKHIEREADGIGLQFGGAGGAFVGGLLLGSLSVASSVEDEEIEKAPTQKKKEELEKRQNQSGGLGFLGLVSILSSIGLTAHAIYKAFEAIDSSDETGAKRQGSKILARKPYYEALGHTPVILLTSKGEFPLGETDGYGRLNVNLKKVIQSETLLQIIDEPVYVVARPEQRLDFSGLQRTAADGDLYNPANPLEVNPQQAQFLEFCKDTQEKTRMQIVRILWHDPNSRAETRYRLKVTLKNGKVMECASSAELLKLSDDQIMAILEDPISSSFASDQVERWKKETQKVHREEQKVHKEEQAKKGEVAALDLKQILLAPEERVAYEKYRNEKEGMQKFHFGLQFLNRFPQSPVKQFMLAWLMKYAEKIFFGTAEIGKAKNLSCQNGERYKFQSGEMVFVESAWSNFDRPDIATILKIIPMDGTCSLLVVDRDDLAVIRNLRNFPGPGGKFTVHKPTLKELWKRTESDAASAIEEDLGISGFEGGKIWKTLVDWIIEHTPSEPVSPPAGSSIIATDGNFPRALCGDSLLVEHMPIKDGDLNPCGFGYSCHCGIGPCKLHVGPGTYKVTLSTGCPRHLEEKLQLTIGPGEKKIVKPPW